MCRSTIHFGRGLVETHFGQNYNPVYPIRKGGPFMDAKEIKEYAKQYVLQSWSKQGALDPIPVERAEGIYFYDYEGNRYADMSSQLVNLNVGFGNEEINRAIREQTEKYCFVGPAYAAEPRVKLAKRLIGLLPDNFGKIFFTNAGADANENAIKIARLYTGRKKVFSRYRSYHGSSFGAGNLTGEPRRYPLEPGIPGFVKFFDPYLYREAISFSSEEEASRFYVEKLREQILYEGPDQVAAIVLETITGSNGVIIPPKGYLPGVRSICDEFGIVMICDEVMAGFGRTGKMFAFEHFGIKPDLVSFAKGVTCGYVQLGGVAVSETIRLCEVPTLREYGIERKTYEALIPKMSEDAVASGSPANTWRPVSEGDCAAIYKKAYER